MDGGVGGGRRSPGVPSAGHGGHDGHEPTAGHSGHDGHSDLPPGRGLLTKPVLAWALYDWGGAAFSAVITTFVFTVYLTSSAFGPKDDNSSALGLGLTIAGVVVALLAPVTGQRSDRSGRATFWLGVNSVLVFVCSALLFFVRPVPSYLWLGIGLVAVGNVFHEFAAVNYNSLLPRVADARNLGRVSALGWGAGYLGGIVLLLFLFLAFINPAVGLFGVTHDDGMNVRVSMLFAAAWFGVSMLPVLFVVRDEPAHSPTARDQAMADPAAEASSGRPARLGLVASYRALWASVVRLGRSDPHTLRYLLAAAVYRDGLAGVFTFGGIIAAGTFGLSAGQVIVFGIVANVVAGIATISLGVLDDRLGPKRVILASLAAMIVAGVGIFVFHGGGPRVFWVLGLIMCIFVGPAQSASRSLLTRLIPAGKEGEVFGLYATTGKAVSFIAPLLFSAFIGVGQRFVPAGADAQYWGILGIMLVLLAGLVLLVPVHARPQEHWRTETIR